MNIPALFRPKRDKYRLVEQVNRPGPSPWEKPRENFTASQRQRPTQGGTIVTGETERRLRAVKVVPVWER